MFSSVSLVTYAEVIHTKTEVNKLGDLLIPTDISRQVTKPNSNQQRWFMLRLTRNFRISTSNKNQMTPKTTEMQMALSSPHQTTSSPKISRKVKSEKTQHSVAISSIYQKTLRFSENKSEKKWKFINQNCRKMEKLFQVKPIDLGTVFSIPMNRCMEGHPLQSQEILDLNNW